MERRTHLKDVDDQKGLSPTFIRIPPRSPNSASGNFLAADSDDESTDGRRRKGIPEVFFAGTSASPLRDSSEHSDSDDITVEEELELAKERIKELETWLDVREKELRATQDKMRKMTNSGRRLRRHARSGDLFRRNDMSPREDTDALENDHLDHYMQLAVMKVCDHDLSTSNSVADDQSQSVVPLYMRRLEAEIFVIGPKGTRIGCDKSCGVDLPPETGMNETHARIKWDSVNNNFYLLSEASSKSKCYLFDGQASRSDELEDAANFVMLDTIPLKHGTIFQTALIKWRVSCVPQRQLLIARLFDAIRQCDLQKLCQLEASVGLWNHNIDHGTLPSQERAIQRIDFNVQEHVDYQIVDENGEVGSRLSCDRYTVTSGDDPITALRSEQKGKFCLLHVAVDHGSLPIVKYVLAKGALVNKQCGLGKFAPLHIAVRHDNCNIVNELLKFGADLELTDASHNLPISIAASYRVRKLLLSSMMLCSAAEGGDLTEVERIISTDKISPNVKGLSHKSPLHLASTNGHTSVVSFLLENGASINMLGGSRQRTALHYASVSDHVNVAKLLIAYGANQDVADVHGYTALNLSNGGEMCRILHKGPLSICLATQAGDINEVRRLLEGGSTSPRRSSIIQGTTPHRKISRTCSERKVSRQKVIETLGLCIAVDQRNEQGHAPLHLAATAGNLDMVELLLSFGASVDLPGGLDKWTPLFYAALAGHADVVGFLLSIGADSEKTDAQGLMAVDHIERNIEDSTQKLERGKLQLSESQDDNPASTQGLVPPQLLRQRSDTSVGGDNHRAWTRKQLSRQQQVLFVLQSGMQRLLQSLEQDDIALFEDVLLRSNIDINAPLTKHTPKTALQYACASGMLEFVELLLTHGADPYLPNNQSYLPIHSAARYGHSDVVLAMVKRGIDINVRSKTQRSTPLHLAAANDREDCIREMLKTGADPSLRDHEGKSPFDVANEPSVQALLAQGTDFLYVAISLGDIDMVRSLVDGKSLSVNVVFKQRLTPLHVACIGDHVSIVDYLLQQGANVNAQGGPENCTPLHIAARSSSTGIALLLIRHGAKLSIANASGKTPFEEATTNAMRKVLVSAQSIRQSHPNEPRTDDNLPTINDSSQEQTCRICFDKPINTIILPCGHQAFCMDCACQLDVCAFDRRAISQIVPVYYAGQSP